MYRGKQKNVRFSTVFAFWQAKEQILFQVQPLQMFFYVLAHFRVTVHIFWGPASSENATLRHEILELGPSNNFAQHRMRSFLFFKITPPYWPCFFQRSLTSKVDLPKQVGHNAATEIILSVSFLLQPSHSSSLPSCLDYRREPILPTIAGLTNLMRRSF